MRVVFCVAVTRKMFHRWQHTVVLKSKCILGSAHCYIFRVLAETAHPDDRIFRLVVNVDIRGKIHIDAKTETLFSYLCAHLANEHLILYGTECHLIRIRNAVVEPHAKSPLAINANHQRSLRHSLPSICLFQQRLSVGTEKRHATDIVFFYKLLNFNKICFIRQIRTNIHKLTYTLLRRQGVVNRVNPTVFVRLRIGKHT